MNRIPLFRVKKIISGGQTGADRAALEFAIQHKIPYGGWIPKGRLTEEGLLPAKFRMKETRSSRYEERTKKNVLDSDATLIFFYGNLSGGSKLTALLAKRCGKPVKAINLAKAPPRPEDLREWLKENKVKRLNIAGSRASVAPKIFQDVTCILEELFFK